MTEAGFKAAASIAGLTGAGRDANGRGHWAHEDGAWDMGKLGQSPELYDLCHEPVDEPLV